MKMKSILSVLAIGAAGLLSSCVDPYYGGTTTTVTTYRPGYVTQTLPGSYRTQVVGGVTYYHHNDVYYRRQGTRYVVVERPVHRDDRYDRRDNRYDRRDDRYDRRDDRYDRDRRDGRYDRDVYHRPGGGTTVVRTLPSGARVVTHRGNRYWESRGVYYRQAPGGYVIVTSPY